MRGTAAILVCLISLHYSPVIDAYTAKFTSENGMPGREHEDKHPRRSANVKRSLSDTMRQEPDYNWEDYGGIPNIPGYMYRDINTDMDLGAYDLDAYDEIYENRRQEISQRLLNPEDQHSQRSASAKRSLSASSDETMRQGNYYYDNWEDSGGIPNILGYMKKSAGADADTGADADKNSISKTLQRLLSPVVDAVRQLWGKLSGGSVGGGETKRENASNEPLKKGAMENRNGEDREASSAKARNGNARNIMADVAKKALDFVYNIIDKLDVSQLTEETKKLKEATLEMLKKVRDAVEELLNNVVSRVESSSSRRARAVGKRTSARDALESFLASHKSQKRSKARHSLRRSMKGSTSARASDMTALMDLMTEMEECIHKIPPTNTSSLGVKCIVLPLMKVLASPKLRGANGLTMDPDSNARSDKIGSPDNLRRLSFPWGSIFLIPIYSGHRPSGNWTEPPHFDQGFDNVTAEPPTTTTTESTTEALYTPLPVYVEPDRAVRSDSKYQSKYDDDI